MKAIEIKADDGEIRIRRPEEVHGGGEDEECESDADEAVRPATVGAAATASVGERE